jgi:hypothetical protein
MRMFFYEKIYILICLLVFGLAFVIISVKVMSAYSSDIQGKNFNRKQWLNDLERIEMSADLQIHYLRKGMSKREVIKLWDNRKETDILEGLIRKAARS